MEEMMKKKNKTTAGLLAIFLGGFGIHKFYLGKIAQGIIYLFFVWTMIPQIIGLIEGIVYLVMSQQKFDEKYNSFERVKVKKENPVYETSKEKEPIMDEVEEPVKAEDFEETVEEQEGKGEGALLQKVMDDIDSTEKIDKNTTGDENIPKKKGNSTKTIMWFIELVITVICLFSIIKIVIFGNKPIFFKSECHVGDTVETGNFKIKYISTEDLGLNDNDNRNIVAEFEFENISKKDAYIGSFECSADGYMANKLGDDLPSSVSSGKKTKGYVFFEVPYDAEDIEFEYDGITFYYEDIDNDEE